MTEIKPQVVLPHPSVNLTCSHTNHGLSSAKQGQRHRTTRPLSFSCSLFLFLHTTGKLMLSESHSFLLSWGAVDILQEVPGTSNRLSCESDTPASMSCILSAPQTHPIEVDGVCLVGFVCACLLVCLQKRKPFLLCLQISQINTSKYEIHTVITRQRERLNSFLLMACISMIFTLSGTNQLYNTAYLKSKPKSIMEKTTHPSSQMQTKVVTPVSG